MKSIIKFFTVLTLFFAFSFAANAQRGDRGQAPDPAQMAERQTTHMVERLQLNEEQTNKVSTINLTYARKMKEAREANKENREAMKGIGATIHAERSAEIQQVLTAEQFKSFEEMDAQRANRRGGKGDRRGGKGGHRGGNGKC